MRFLWYDTCNICNTSEILENNTLTFLSDAAVGAVAKLAVKQSGGMRTLHILKKTALSIIADTGAVYLHLLPSPSLYQAYLNSVTAVPETIFIDANGNQIGDRYVGAKSHSQWKMVIENLLDTLE